ncbi:hypothetical protein [Neorhizobium sp. S3-V5DH]|uniref:hypothetical protein n=1 Tax=Neorhizobium sp. S3-V5DH TaxID=2485166 RepID=UPI0010F40F1E|nr:hypothetical protein [Neorhizobium sp. S3-V5DH]TCV68681.1 peptidase M41-like protein [Neorhizobium sp. S3-V5DH]
MADPVALFAATVDEEVRRIVNDTFERTLALLQEQTELLIRSAETLLQSETREENDLASLMEGAIEADGRRGPG